MYISIYTYQSCTHDLAHDACIHVYVYIYIHVTHILTDHELCIYVYVYIYIHVTHILTDHELVIPIQRELLVFAQRRIYTYGAVRDSYVCD